MVFLDVSHSIHTSEKPIWAATVLVTGLGIFTRSLIQEETISRKSNYTLEVNPK